MEPLLPALHNLPVFYTVLISLLFMAGLSGFALYRQWRRRPPGRGFSWLKGLTPEPEGEALTVMHKQLDDLEQQRVVLLNADPENPD